VKWCKLRIRTTISGRRYPLLKLTVDNSMANIAGLSPQQHKQLADTLSYTLDPQASYFSGSHRKKQTLLGKRGDFPTGLLYAVKSWLLENRISNTTEDVRKRPRSLQDWPAASLGYQPYPEQEEAAQACLENHRGIVVAPTGFGKSAIVALIIDKLKVRTLVVVPGLELKRQLTETLQKAFAGLDVGGLGCSIAIENVDSLDTTRKLTGYDCIIIDEFHHSGAKTYRTLNKKAWGGVFFRFGLTATPFRSQDNERLLLESVLSEVIYRVEYQKAVDRGYIVPIEAYYYDLPRRVVNGYTWAEVYKELVVDNESRNALVGKLLVKLHASGVSTLCLVKEINHGHNISKESAFISVFMFGDNDCNEDTLVDFNRGDNTSLLGTIGVLGEGVDTKPAEFIILAGLGKSKNSIMQQCGRGFRRSPGKDSCKIILFRDPSHKWTLRHFKAQCKILKDEYGAAPAKLPLDF